MVKTAAPEHMLTPALGRLLTQAGHTGLVLGRDGAGSLVTLPFFRPLPTAVTLVGGWWAARVLVFRCLGLGALVAVRAGGGLAATTHWTALDTTAGGTGRRVWPMPGDRLDRPAESARLMLHLYDVGPAGPQTRPALGAWQTQLTVLARLTPAGAAAVASADVVLAQRLGPAEAQLLASALGQGESTVSLLRTLTDDMVAVCTRDAEHYAWFAPTSIERRLFGEPAPASREIPPAS